MSAWAFVLYPLAAVVGLLLLVVAALILLPFHVEARGQIDDGEVDGRLQASFGWWLLALRLDPTGLRLRLLGIPLWRLRGGDGEKRTARRERRREKQRAKRESSEKSDKGPGLRTTWRHREGLFELLRGMIGALPVRGHLYGTVGLGDPADTAALFGLLAPLAARSDAMDIDVEPDWLDETLDLDGALTLRLWLAHLLAAVLWRLLTDGRVRRGAWAMVRSS